MTRVRCTFYFYPDQPDDGDPTGLSEEEFDEMSDSLQFNYGAEDIDMERMADPTVQPKARRKK